MLDKYTNQVKVTIKDSDHTNEDMLVQSYKVANIEILEEKIIKFNSGHINDILETIKNKYPDIDYYIRKKENDLHIIKYNENLNLNVNEFVNSLLKYYSTKNDTKKIINGIKVKGNNKFVIIENMKYDDKFINDLTKLLSNRKIK